MSDPLIARYLAHRRAIARHRAGRDDGNADDADDALAFAESPLLRERQHWWSRLRAHLPLAANLTRPEFVPTMSMVFMEMLHEKFPRHRVYELVAYLCIVYATNILLTFLRRCLMHHICCSAHFIRL